MRHRAFVADKIFFALVMGAALAGLAVFSSAKLGLLAREGATISDDILLQAGLGLGGGLVALFMAAWTPLSLIKKYALAIYIATLVLTALVFTGLGYSANGATRWLDLGFTTMQPGELLK